MFDGKLGYSDPIEWMTLIQIHRNGIIGKPSDAEGATQRYYYLNNMNAFINTMIVLMELSVVNNWQVVMDMYIQITNSHYYRIFLLLFIFVRLLLY